MDMIARRLGLDPLEFRCTNMLAPGETLCNRRTARTRQRTSRGGNCSKARGHLIGYGGVTEEAGGRGIGLSGWP